MATFRKRGKYWEYRVKYTDPPVNSWLLHTAGIGLNHLRKMLRKL